jgi:hypothetical protein
MSDTLRYVPHSAVPPQKEPDMPDDWLRWVDWYTPKEGVTFTYRVTTASVGYLPVGASTSATLVDNKDRERTYGFPVPWITVLRPDVLSTPAWAPTDTPTPPRQVTATPTTLPPLTPVPTPHLRSLYLPALANGREP